VPLPIATKLLNYYYYVYGTVATQLNVRMNSNKKCQIKPIATNAMASCNKKNKLVATMCIGKNAIILENGT
jgi:hypothetical protein